MEESNETFSSKKKRTRSKSSNEVDAEYKSDKEPETVVPNGTGNSTEDTPQEDKTSPIKISKVPKTPKSSLKDSKTSIAKKALEKSPEPSSSSSSHEDFCGFQDLSDSDDLIANKKAIQRLISNLEDEIKGRRRLEDEGQESKEVEELEMTVEDADGEAVDSDSNQMEIDEGNSNADSMESIDKKTKELDADVMDTDSVKSGENKTEEEGNTSGEHKVEYCGACSLVVDDEEEGIFCEDKCGRWFHLRCSGLSQTEYNELSSDENAKWACSRCSGKSPPELKPGAKPLLTVRKDLTATPVEATTPSSTPKRRTLNREDKRPKIDISNPIYLKPFDYGWKRELVYRQAIENSSRKQGDVYYYTPKGKKLRSLREVSEYLTDTDLTVDNFTFMKDPIGCDSDKEIIRDAKIKVLKEPKDPSASPAVIKKVMTPKAPKEKTPKATPKLTATVTPIMESAAATTPKVSASVTPRVVLKAGKVGGLSVTPKLKLTPKTTPVQSPKIVIGKDKKKKTDSDDELEMGMLPPTWDPIQKTKDKVRPMGVCSIRCLPAMGLIPTLQCVVCVCLYHPECVGLGETGQTTIHNYKCKNCQLEKPKPPAPIAPKSLPPPPPLTPALSSVSTSTAPVTHMMVPQKNSLHRILDSNLNRTVEPRNRPAKSIVGGVTTWLPPSSTIQLRSPAPPKTSQKPLPPTWTQDTPAGQPVQSMMNTGLHRFIVVPKHNVLSVTPSTTSTTQVSDSVSTLVTTTSDSGSTLTQAFAPGCPIMPKPPVSTPTFIMGSPATPNNSFQSPPGVLLVPYIAPNPSSAQKDGQPQYIVVNGPTGLQPGNFIFGNIPQPQQQMKLPTVPTSQPAEPLAV